jgi:hypothetical protein
MSNEFYLCGCVGIARAAGGNLQQIVPLRELPSFTAAVRERADRWHNAQAKSTGLLYWETPIASARGDWAKINRAEYDPRGLDLDRLEQRRNLPLFRAMAEALADTLKQAAEIYQDRPHLYYAMLAHGIDYILTNFNWKRETARKYARVLYGPPNARALA